MKRKDPKQVDRFLKETISFNLIKFLRARNWSLQKLSKRSGVSASYLGYVRARKNRPTLYKLVLIADALNINVEQFWEKSWEEK